MAPIRRFSIVAAEYGSAASDGFEVLVVHARSSTFRLRVPPARAPALRPGARITLALARRLWESEPGWEEVEPEPCPQCGAWQAVCVLCGAPARHFVGGAGGAEDPVRSTYLCDGHAPDPEELPEGEELGMYAETDGCACDAWR